MSLAHLAGPQPLVTTEPITQLRSYHSWYVLETGADVVGARGDASLFLI